MLMPPYTDLDSCTPACLLPEGQCFARQVGEAARDREAAKNVQCSLEYTTLKRVTEATEIYYDPIPDVRLSPAA